MTDETFDEITPVQPASKPKMKLIHKDWRHIIPILVGFGMMVAAPVIWLSVNWNLIPWPQLPELDFNQKLIVLEFFGLVIFTAFGFHKISKEYKPLQVGTYRNKGRT